MTSGVANYNERSWAIDLIGHLKQLAFRSNHSIKDAGGEQTIRTEGGSLFPDVLLFGDRSTTRILQGWELKMPDTDIEAPEFRANAEVKAEALGLDSFLLWNVSHARLYVREAQSGKFECKKSWSELEDVGTRKGVLENRQRWESLAEEIFDHLNSLFDSGLLEGRQFIEAYKSGGVSALLMENSSQVADSLSDAISRDATLRAQTTLWWDSYNSEYAGRSMETVLAQAVISNWIGKLLFAHILREKDVRARRVAEISESTTPAEALKIFEALSEDCNFWTIFSDSVGLRAVPDAVWRQLKQFNSLLSDLRLGAVDQEQLSSILEATAEVAVRKLRGQYPTPIELARLLVQLCLRDVVEDRLLDPCCGSGTIVRAAMEQRLAAGVSPTRVADTLFAGDQDPLAVQIATFALTKPALMHVPMRIFQRDAFELQPNTQIEFRNPTDGAVFSETLGKFDAITSNLPFVSQGGRARYAPSLSRITSTMAESGQQLSGRADVAAYLPFALHPLLVDRGRLGIIITNAWLGTDWGDAFFDALQRYYVVRSVITSGAGRWFNNSEVVTNIIVMEKKAAPSQPTNDVNFIVFTRPLEEIADIETSQIMAAQVELGQTQGDTMTIRSVDQATLSQFKRLGLGGSAQFVDCDWVLSLPLIPLKTIFEIKRGERRGMNALFYPRSGHGIEDEYIRPLAKSPTDFPRLSCPAAREAFSCSRSEEELHLLGHHGALSWIQQFKTPRNIAKLSIAGMHWYEMRADTLTDLVMFINYGERLFVGRVDPPAFADQRLVRLEPRFPVDIHLLHALLNSTISMFIIEGMGFGRGLGALDLNKDRIETFMNVLDPSRLNSNSADRIKAAFAPLLERDVLSVADELESADRKAFDDEVLTAFAPDVDRERIYNALLSLVGIRQAAME